jgi:hypothetical protein
MAMYENGRKKPRPLRSRSRVGSSALKARTVFLVALSTSLVATAGFGVFPSNPVSDGVRSFISENYPALVLEPINSVLQDVAVATLQGQSETVSEIASASKQTSSGVESAGLAGAAGAVSSSTFTDSPTGTSTSIPSPTSTYTFTPTITSTPTATETPTPTPTQTMTPTYLPTWTDSPVPTREVIKYPTTTGTP